MRISPTMMVNNMMKVRRVMRLKFPIHIYIENIMDMKYLMICLGVNLLIYGESKTKVEALIYPCGLFNFCEGKLHGTWKGDFFRIYSLIYSLTRHNWKYIPKGLYYKDKYNLDDYNTVENVVIIIYSVFTENEVDKILDQFWHNHDNSYTNQ